MWLATHLKIKSNFRCPNVNHIKWKKQYFRIKFDFYMIIFFFNKIIDNNNFTLIRQSLS